MDKKIALVTGGTGGIGTSICQALAESGHQVIAAYFKNGDHECARAWQQQQRTLGFDFDINYANLTDFDECQAMTEQVVEKFGRIDVLVNNAGRINDSPFKKMTASQWREVIENNLNSIFNLSRQVIDGMIKNQYGRIISISSINGHKGQFGQCNYAASKSAMYGFTKSLALEVAKYGVTVNSVSPGYIETDMVKSLSDDIRERIIQQIPVKRLGQPEEIARLVSFIADDRSGFITGSDFNINGGQYMV